LALAAIFAPRLAPYEPLAGRLSDILLPPAWMDGGSGAHLLGTDKLGRDEVSRLIYGTRVSLAAGLSAAVIAAVIGVPLGVVGGYMGGRVDSAIAVALNIVLGFPFILLALLIAAVVGPGFRNVIVILFWNADYPSDVSITDVVTLAGVQASVIGANLASYQ